MAGCLSKRHIIRSAIEELKTGRFEPEHMGKLAFYPEALDRDRKRPHENPSIGVLLCRTKDDEVVEYAMNRHLSPALLAQVRDTDDSKGAVTEEASRMELALEFECSRGRLRAIVGIWPFLRSQVDTSGTILH